MPRPAVLALRVLSVAVLAAGMLVPAEARRPRRPPPPPPVSGGGDSGGTVGAASACGALNPTEVSGLLNGAAASIGVPDLAVAVVDRPGNLLGLYVQGSPTPAQQETALGLARTGAFFSNDQAPLSSRTVRFISGLHFPPGIARTPNAALYGIENTNRGCDLNVTWNPGPFPPLPRATSIAGGTCNAGNTSGCGTGPVTGKVDPNDSKPSAVNPGGMPIFRDNTLVGGIGVAGVPPGQIDAAEFAAFSAVLSSATFTPFPVPFPEPQVVFIDGIRLPFVRQTQRPAGVSAGPATTPATTTLFAAGQCAPDGYLAGPVAGSKLALGEVQQIVQQAIDAAKRTRAVIRLPIGQRTHMAIAVGDVDGKILALYRMPDATVFSVDVAVAKARNVAYFSGSGAGDLGPGLPLGTAITSRTLGFGGQPLYPAGIDGSGPGPFFDLFKSDYLNPCSQGLEAPGPNQNGIVFFPGSLPLYRGGQLIGGLGVSGDGVEQDDYVTFLGAAGFLPPAGLQADHYFLNGVRLPFLKFPRNPEQ